MYIWSPLHSNHEESKHKVAFPSYSYRDCIRISNRNGIAPAWNTDRELISMTLRPQCSEIENFRIFFRVGQELEMR